MLKKLVRFYRKKGLKKYWPGIAWFFIIVVLLLLPGKDLPEHKDWMDFLQFDKIIHMGLFGSLVFLWLFPVYISTKSIKRQRQLTAILIIGVIAFGILSEYAQAKFTEGRQFDYGDWIADSLGAILAIFGTMWIARWINKKYAREVRL